MSLMDLLATNFDQQQSSLINSETERRDQVAKQKPEKLKTINGQKFNLSARGELRPTELITNKRIDDGELVARKSTGFSDQIPRNRLRRIGGERSNPGDSILSSRNTTARSRNYLARLEIDFLNFIFELDSETGFNFLSAAQEQAIPEVTKEPEGYNGENVFYIPINIGSLNFSRGDFDDPYFSYEKAGYTGSYFQNIQDTGFSGLRLASDTALKSLEDQILDEGPIEFRLSGLKREDGSNYPEELISQISYLVQSIEDDPERIVQGVSVEFKNIQILGLKGIKLPEYKITREQRSGLKGVATGMRIKDFRLVVKGF